MGKRAEKLTGELMPAGKSKGGRPTKFSNEALAFICQELAKGIPLTVVCNGSYTVDEDPNELERPAVMPRPRTVRDWEAADPEVAAAIARAREDGEYALAEQCLEIAHNEEHDWAITKKGVITNEVAIGRAKLQVDTHLKLLAKFNPKKWGDKQQIEHSGKLSLENLIADPE